MPDQELLSLAAQLRRDADELRRLVGPIRAETGPDVVDGGRFAESIDELLELSRRELEGQADALDVVAGQLVAVAIAPVEV